MTDKLHCPYCGEELSNDFGVIFCYNEACKIHGCELNERVIRDIINGKKAQDALKVATDFIGFVNTSRHADGALAAMAICKLNEITSITKQEE